LLSSCVAPTWVDITFLWAIVQKLQDKSTFTNDEKVIMMQSIAEEFSVPFNSNTLEVKICWWREQMSQVTFNN
jgi:hypothetical protein